ncbi:MAG: aminomethyl-transferring glycine dehydrogenase subunit GcvPA [Hydrogenoanaerobacterium sp.]
MGSYIPSSKDERAEMLAAVGCKSINELFADVPDKVLLKKPLNLPHGLSEIEVRRAVTDIADKNTVFKTIFRGAGAYNHYIPAIVKSVAGKEEFLTAYTPYQAEISQGILQSIFEYQTMICELTGMDASNASVYDGASAAGEAVAMCKERGRVKAFISATTHPDVIQTVQTYCDGANTELVVVPAKDGVTDIDALKALLDDKSSCFLVQQPNYYGILEDAQLLGEVTHAVGAKYIMSCNPMTLAVLKTPAEYGADIAVGDGQPFGMPLAFGGPYLGYMAAKSTMVRKLPGRIVGETADIDGKRAYVLTLQAREQHIRREKASSNICSNQALCALTATVYLAAMGQQGLCEAAEQCCSKAHYLAAELAKAGFTQKYNKEFFHEFVTASPIAVDAAVDALESNGILGGYPLSGELEGCILWCATEQNTKDEIDKTVAILKEAAHK